MKKADSKISNLMHGARLQDYLLQTYRSMHLTSQSILFAIGTGLTVFNAKGFENRIDSYIIFVLTIAFATGGILFSRSFSKVTRSRESDVDYWHGKLLEFEQKIPVEDQFFTNFKKHQLSHNLDINVRAKLRKKLFCWIPAMWIFLILASIYFTFL